MTQAVLSEIFLKKLSNRKLFLPEWLICRSVSAGVTMRQPTLLLLLFTCYFLLTMNRRAFQFAIPMVESETWINKTDIGESKAIRIQSRQRVFISFAAFFNWANFANFRVSAECDDDRMVSIRLYDDVDSLFKLNTLCCFLMSDGVNFPHAFTVLLEKMPLSSVRAWF